MNKGGQIALSAPAVSPPAGMTRPARNPENYFLRYSLTASAGITSSRNV